ncbi:transposase [Chryseobacterium sp. A321]
MKKKHKKIRSSFKAQVVVEALKERPALSELAVKFGLHPIQILQWKQKFLENSALVFEQKTKSATSDNDVDVEKLYSKIGSYRWRWTFKKKSLARLGL